MRKNPIAQKSDGTNADKVNAVVAYLRVSTDTQAENGQSLSIQLETIQKYCKEKSLNLVKTYSDPGISGSLADRPALSELLQEARNKKFEKVIVAKMDRLARDLFVQLWIEKELLIYDIELVSIAEPYKGDEPMNIAMRQIVGVFAQLERGRITERLLSGRMKKLDQGKYAGGGVPRGYRPKNRELVLDKYESQVVEKIFRLRFGRKSLNRIAKLLNEERIPNRNGIKWYASTIQYILRNPFYKGLIRYGRTEKGIHPRLAILNKISRPTITS